MYSPTQFNFNGNFWDEGQIYRLTDAFNEAEATISRPFNTSNPYGLMDAENNQTVFAQIAAAYLLDYCDYTNSTDGYFASIDRILNYPSGPDAGGVTWITSGGQFNPNPIFLFTGYIREVAPSAYTTQYVMIGAIHELGHQIAIQGHTGHGQQNQSCCVMMPTLNSACYLFCGNHLCLINESLQ